MNAQVLISIDATKWSDAQRKEALAALDAIAGRTAIKIKLPKKTEAATVWTREDLTHLGDRLRKYPAQLKVIEACFKGGGFISRADVYKITGYNEKHRSLKGFTRPVSRTQKELADAGIISDKLGQFLRPVYDGSVAIGFRVPADIRSDYPFPTATKTGTIKFGNNLHPTPNGWKS